MVPHTTFSVKQRSPKSPKSKSENANGWFCEAFLALCDRSCPVTPLAAAIERGATQRRAQPC
jgi:hypothetical protein